MKIRSIWLRLGLVAAVCSIIAVCAPDSTVPAPFSTSSRAEREVERLSNRLAPDTAPGATVRDGVAAAILIDVSGSMERPAGESDRTPKIEIARRAALDLVEQFAKYAESHKDEPVLLGIYEFSSRSGRPDAREVIPMGPPDRAAAASAVASMHADGGTPIGDAMIIGKKALDRTSLTRRHLLVVTDGENTDGPAPESVAAAIARRPDAERPSLYFVAFDIEASRFDAVKTAGGLVLGAANGRALGETLDSLLGGKILIER